MSVSLAEPSSPQYVEIQDESQVQFGHADVLPSELWVQELRFDNPADCLVLVLTEPEAEEGEITHLDEGYRVLQPIPYEIRRLREGDFLATFADANIGIGGVDAQDAYQSLVAEILDTFDTLTSQERLSAVALRQLQVLRTYLVRA